jgi:tRNA(fMet)-specific endonuclease VapC
MFIADTDVLIDFLRGTGQADRIAIEIGTGRLCTTAITAFELWAGSESSRQAAVVESLLEALTILPLDFSCARRAGEIRRNLERAGSSIGMADSLIAGIAVEKDAILITRNLKHYQRVPGLKLSHHFSSRSTKD